MRPCILSVGFTRGRGSAGRGGLCHPLPSGRRRLSMPSPHSIVLMTISISARYSHIFPRYASARVFLSESLGAHRLSADRHIMFRHIQVSSEIPEIAAMVLEYSRAFVGAIRK
eukprot:3345090-Pleurochrysis_carterae.AAC.2